VNISLTNDAVGGVGLEALPAQKRKAIFNILRHAKRDDMVEIGDSANGTLYSLGAGSFDLLLVHRPGSPEDEVVVVSVLTRQEPQTLKATGEVHDQRAKAR
jgi:predicted oxidoreductase